MAKLFLPTFFTVTKKVLKTKSVVYFAFKKIFLADIFRFLQYCNLIILECSGKILDQAEHQAVCGEAWAWQHQQREHCQDFLQNRSKDDCIYFENRL